MKFVEFDEYNPFDVGDCDEEDKEVRDMYVNAVKETIYGNSFDIEKDPCLACGKHGHTFKSCPVLNNTEFLKRHYIGFCTLMKRTNRNKESMTINSLRANDAEDNPVRSDDEDFLQGQI